MLDFPSSYLPSITHPLFLFLLLVEERGGNMYSKRRENERKREKRESGRYFTVPRVRVEKF